MKTLLAIATLVFLQHPEAAIAQNTSRWYEVSGGAWRVPASTAVDIQRQLQEAANGAVAASATKEKRSVQHDIIQYQGEIDEKSKRKMVRIWGSCKTDLPSNKLKSEFAIVMDGGNCYYHAMYDPALRRFSWFIFNGAA